MLALAREEERVLVTEDKDFGELILVCAWRPRASSSFVEMWVVEKVAAMRELIECHEDAMREGALVVLTRGCVRIRFKERDDRENE